MTRFALLPLNSPSVVFTYHGDDDDDYDLCFQALLSVKFDEQHEVAPKTTNITVSLDNAKGVFTKFIGNLKLNTKAEVWHDNYYFNGAVVDMSIDEVVNITVSV